MAPRTSAELSSVDDPAWPLVVSWVDDASAPVEVLEPDAEMSAKALYRLQVSASSVLGGVVLNCGGLLVDHGWFRILGGGAPGLPDVATANGLAVPTLVSQPPGSLVVGYDAVGGCFAVDGGGLGVAPGQVCYFGPDSLSWGGLGGGHADWIRAVLTGSLVDAFASLRWSGWQEEVAGLRPDQGLSLWPPPFTREGRDIAAASRRPVPLAELLGFYRDAANQVDEPE